MIASDAQNTPAWLTAEVRSFCGSATVQWSHAVSKCPHKTRLLVMCLQVWPRIKEAGTSGLLIFAASYFEFVRLRGFLKEQRASLAVNSEYTDSSNVMRARTRFRLGERKILLYTERAHFYFRPNLKCALRFPVYSESCHTRKQDGARSEVCGTCTCQSFPTDIHIYLSSRGDLACAFASSFYSSAILHAPITRRSPPSIICTQAHSLCPERDRHQLSAT